MKLVIQTLTNEGFKGIAKTCLLQTVGEMLYDNPRPGAERKEVILSDNTEVARLRIYTHSALPAPTEETPEPEGEETTE